MAGDQALKRELVGSLDSSTFQGLIVSDRALQLRVGTLAPDHVDSKVKSNVCVAYRDPESKVWPSVRLVAEGAWVNHLTLPGLSTSHERRSLQRATARSAEPRVHTANLVWQDGP